MPEKKKLCTIWTSLVIGIRRAYATIDGQKVSEFMVTLTVDELIAIERGLAALWQRTDIRRPELSYPLLAALSRLDDLSREEGGLRRNGHLIEILPHEVREQYEAKAMTFSEGRWLPYAERTGTKRIRGNRDSLFDD